MGFRVIQCEWWVQRCVLRVKSHLRVLRDSVLQERAVVEVHHVHLGQRRGAGVKVRVAQRGQRLGGGALKLYLRRVK